MPPEQFVFGGRTYRYDQASGSVQYLRGGQWLPAPASQFNDAAFVTAYTTAKSRVGGQANGTPPKDNPIRGVGTKPDGTTVFVDANHREVIPDGAGGYRVDPNSTPLEAVPPTKNTQTRPQEAGPSIPVVSGVVNAVTGATPAGAPPGSAPPGPVEAVQGAVGAVQAATGGGTAQAAAPAATAAAPAPAAGGAQSIMDLYNDPANLADIQQAKLYATQATETRAHIAQIQQQLAGQVTPDVKSALQGQMSQLLIQERTALQNYSIASAGLRQKGLTLPTDTALTAAQANRANVQNSIDIYNANNDAMLKWLQQKVQLRQLNDSEAMQQYSNWLSTSKTGLDVQLREIDQTEAAREHNINFGVAMAQTMAQQQQTLLANSAPAGQIASFESQMNDMVANAGRPMGAPIQNTQFSLGAGAPNTFDPSDIVKAAIASLPASDASKSAVLGNDWNTSIGGTPPGYTPGQNLEDLAPAAPDIVTPPANAVTGVTAAQAAAASAPATTAGVISPDVAAAAANTATTGQTGGAGGTVPPAVTPADTGITTP